LKTAIRTPSAPTASFDLGALVGTCIQFNAGDNSERYRVGMEPDGMQRRVVSILILVTTLWLHARGRCQQLWLSSGVGRHQETS